MSPAVRIAWQRYGLTAILALAAIACLAALGIETRWGQALRPPLPVANSVTKATDIVAILPDYSLPPLDSAFKESAERPLFTPTRRPAAVNLASAPAMKKGQFKLSGTSVGSDLAVAYLVEAATGKTVRVTKGKEINGMTLDAVEANRVILKLGDETEELVLRTASSPPAPKVAPPAPNAAPAGSPIQVPVPTPQPANAAPAATATRAANAPNPLVPAPGSSQLPGFVMPFPPSAAPAQAAPAEGAPAQRRRRNQTSPQE